MAKTWLKYSVYETMGQVLSNGWLRLIGEGLGLGF